MRLAIGRLVVLHAHGVQALGVTRSACCDVMANAVTVVRGLKTLNVLEFYFQNAGL